MNTDSRIGKRGTIIKVPDSTPGLIVVEGTQKPFVLEAVWRAPMAPAVNQAVEVETDSGGAVVSVTALDPRLVARERIEQLGGMAKVEGAHAAELARQGAGALAARMGRVALGATIALWIAWFFLPAIKFSLFGSSMSLTAWNVLGRNLGPAGTAVESHGAFALLGLLVITAPVAAAFWRHPRARLLNLAPLVDLVGAFVKIRWSISSAGSAVRQVGNTGMAMMGGEMQSYLDQMAKAAMKAMLDAISFGFGLYVLVAAALVLAFQAARPNPS